MTAIDDPDLWTLPPVRRFAFVMVEKLGSSHDALNERWHPYTGAIPADDPRFRYAVFTWNTFRQEWARDGEGGFYDARLAQARAEQFHRDEMARLQLDV